MLHSFCNVPRASNRRKCHNQLSKTFVSPETPSVRSVFHLIQRHLKVPTSPVHDTVFLYLDQFNAMSYYSKILFIVLRKKWNFLFGGESLTELHSVATSGTSTWQNSITIHKRVPGKKKKIQKLWNVIFASFVFRKFVVSSNFRLSGERVNKIMLVTVWNESFIVLLYVTLSQSRWYSEVKWFYKLKRCREQLVDNSVFLRLNQSATLLTLCCCFLGIV